MVKFVQFEMPNRVGGSNIVEVNPDAVAMVYGHQDPTTHAQTGAALVLENGTQVIVAVSQTDAKAMLEA